jgi:CheY-like chemotaxis protein
VTTSVFFAPLAGGSAMGRTPTHCQATKDSAPRPPTLQGPQNGNPLRPSLLVVDDDADQLLVLSHLLRRCGYHVVTADHPRQALVAASAGQFQVAILDASLPDVDGIELMKRLKRSQSDLQVIILSGYDFAQYDSPEHLAKADCAFACLVKPCPLALLEATIADAIDHALDAVPYDENFDAQLDTLHGDPVGA